MRKSFLLLFLLSTAFSFLSCSDNDDIQQEEPLDLSRDLVFLKVDFQTNTFLGGTEYHFNDVPMTATIPFEETYIPPVDFGNYSLKYTPTDTMVFDGPLSWMGGTYNYPVENNATYFANTTNSAIVNLESIEYFTPTADIIATEGYSDFNYQTIWDAVKNLEITNQYMNDGAKVGILLYTPGLGLFNPESASWFVILYK